MRQVVLITGHICTGKSGLARRLSDEFGYFRIQTSDVLKVEAKRRRRGLDRQSLQKLGDDLDAATDSEWLFREFVKRSRQVGEDRPIVIDSVRTWAQLEHFRVRRDIKVLHAHLYASREHLLSRFEGKHGAPNEFEAADIIKDEGDIPLFKEDADVRINTNFTDGRDTLVRVASRLGLYASRDTRCVDVIVGGQYGSEGKGQIAAYLAKDYDVLLRVGGPNAGHTVSGREEVFTYHQLPSGAKDTDALLLLGPGMTIDVEGLLREVADCKVTPERLFIDPLAIIIEPEDKIRETGLRAAISSTASGSGSAASRRIMGRGDPTVRLARDVAVLRPYVGDSPPYRGRTLTQLELAYSKGYSILFEGTQGSGLSIFHGPYPHVTSRDTNVSGCLAEAGISPSRVRKILMVVRPTPIRVANPEGGSVTSGALKHEVDFRAVAKKASLDADDVLKHEKTSTTKRDRRVGWFEWEQFRQACALNVPTDIVLTFADYLDSRNGQARRFEQLAKDTIKFIEELEHVAGAPVTLVNTRFPRTAEERLDLRTVIDRRSWSTKRASVAVRPPAK